MTIYHSLCPFALPRIARIRKREGRCYELAARGALDHPEWTLVHGALLLTGIGHAWLVRDGWVYDAVKDKVYNAEHYAALTGARPFVSFSGGMETAQAMRLWRHWGPWHDVDVV